MTDKRKQARLNPGRSTAWERAGYKNEEAYKEYQKEYYKKNKERILTNKKDNKLRNTLRHLRRRSQEKGLDCDIDMKYLESILVDVCPILGVKFSSENRTNDNSMTLDRIDPNKGYIKGNVQFISHKANRMKSNATPDELVKFAEYIQRAYT